MLNPLDSIKQHQKLFGYNFEKLPYPIKENKEFQKKWIERINGNYNFPPVFVPEVGEVLVCIHGYAFSESDGNLVRESENIILYTEQNEKVFNIPVFSRRSLGPCKCLQRLDGTKYLIWNLGQGRFIDFPVLYSYLQKWVNSGIKIYAMWKSIYNSAMSSGISCTLKYDDLHRSICGFMNNLNIDF